MTSRRSIPKHAQGVNGDSARHYRKLGNEGGVARLAANAPSCIARSV